MRTRGEIEAAASDGISRFMLEFMGRGPKSVRSHLLGDMIMVRIQGALTAAEQHLISTLDGGKGRELFKTVRTHLVENSRTRLEAMIEEATEAKCVSLHHDVSTTTGEEVFVFTLDESPETRQAKRK